MESSLLNVVLWIGGGLATISFFLIIFLSKLLYKKIDDLEGNLKENVKEIELSFKDDVNELRLTINPVLQKHTDTINELLRFYEIFKVRFEVLLDDVKRNHEWNKEHYYKLNDYVTKDLKKTLEEHLYEHAKHNKQASNQK